LPGRELVVVGDNAFAALDFLDGARQAQVTVIARLRLDAALYTPAPPYSGKGRPRKKGQRLPTLVHHLGDPKTIWKSVELAWYDGQQRRMDVCSDTAVWFHNGKPPVPIRWVLIRDPQGHYDPVALLCTDPQQTVTHIVMWFVQRWRLEVTFEEARRHLGFETQRHWSDKAIARTTPLLLGMFSWVTLAAHSLYRLQPSLQPRQAIWYAKSRPTFADALALVRQYLWSAYPTFRISEETPDMIQIPKPLLDTLISTLCYAA
jgi:hypothetical protein